MERHEGIHSHHGISNGRLAAIFWYIVAAVVALLWLHNLFTLAQRKTRAWTQWSLVGPPSRPRPPLLYRIALLLRRQAQRRLECRGTLSWLSPPAAGRTLVLLLYLATCIFLSTYGIDFLDQTYLDRTATRTGWIALTQVPLLLHLGVRGPTVLTFFTGISYERIQWAHHWVGRLVVAISAVHGVSFFLEWLLAGVFWAEWKMMQHAKYGLVAMAVLFWMGISSLVPVRRWSYEVFVLQHRVSVVLFLLFLYVHLPQHHRMLSIISFAVFTWNLAASWLSLAVQVIRRYYSCRHGRCSSTSCQKPWRLTLEAILTAPSDEITLVEVKGVHSRWSSGQHVLVWVPRLWWHTAHPFTIVNAYESNTDWTCQNIKLIMRAKTGFTRVINRLAEERGGQKSIRVYISEPYGAPPRLDDFETIVLASASTGASFTLPILEDLLNGSVASARQIHVLLAARDRSQVEPYLHRILSMKDILGDRCPNLKVEIAISDQAKTAVREIAENPIIRGEEEGGDELHGLIIGDEILQEGDEDSIFELGQFACPAPKDSEKPGSVIDESAVSAFGTNTPGFSAKRFQRQKGPPVPSPLQHVDLATASPAAQSLTGRTLGPADDRTNNSDFFDVGSEASAANSDTAGRQSRDDTVFGSILDEEGNIALEVPDMAGGAFEIHETAGRQNLNAYIGEAMCSSVGRVCVVTCGGKEFTGATRRAVHGRARGNDIWFHAEEFGS